MAGPNKISILVLTVVSTILREYELENVFLDVGSLTVKVIVSVPALEGAEYKATRSVLGSWLPESEEVMLPWITDNE